MHRLAAVLVSVTAVFVLAGCGDGFGPADQPDWSPDGRLIAFTSNVGGSLDVYVAPRGGGKPRRLTRHRGNDALPAFSPDGRRIAFVSDREGDPEIYVMNANGTGQRRLTRSRGADVWPAWSPDGSEIAFATERDAAGTRDESARIYVMRADGSKVRPLTPLERGTVHATPAWSPDRTRIAFTVVRESGDDVEIAIDAIGVNGSGRIRLVAGGLDPDWSPDGRRIAFTSALGDEPQIRLLAVDGSEDRILSPRGVAEWSPDWSADGSEIVFSRHLGRRGSQIHRVAAAGGRAVAVTRLAFARAAGGERCTIRGTPGRDTLVGTAGRDVICGLGGDDVLRGRGGRDVLDGGPGEDRIDAGGGDDTLTGGAGDDALDGGAGKDAVSGGPGDDEVLARDGYVDRVDGGQGRDRGRADRDDWVRDVEALTR